ncbi:MAG: class I SAM-dependent methyltransferase [Acidobacteriota bacterium]|nr:class I SAM-dependent methyltransferase [Acidobacteriota bacterium]
MSLQDEIAESLDGTVELLPYLPDLLQDLFAIGCSPDSILEVVRPLGLDRRHRALDLACGKGAAGLTLAQELGVFVRGVDAFEPFVLEARRRAVEMHLDSRCVFELGDVREVVKAGDDTDLVIYASVGMLGRHDRCAESLRRCVRAGGYIVIDDGFLAEDVPLGSGYGHYATYEETRRRLTANAIELVAEKLGDSIETAESNAAMTKAIRMRAAELSREHPEHEPLLRAYVGRQEEECAKLARWFRPAVWALRT